MHRYNCRFLFSTYVFSAVPLLLLCIGDVSCQCFFLLFFLSFSLPSTDWPSSLSCSYSLPGGPWPPRLGFSPPWPTHSVHRNRMRRHGGNFTPTQTRRRRGTARGTRATRRLCCLRSTLALAHNPPPPRSLRRANPRATPVLSSLPLPPPLQGQQPRQQRRRRRRWGRRRRERRR